MRIYRATCDVSIDDPRNFSGETIRKGTMLYEFTGNTYGCVDFSGALALTLNSDGSNPFFEYPIDAVEEVQG